MTLFCTISMCCARNLVFFSCVTSRGQNHRLGGLQNRWYEWPGIVLCLPKKNSLPKKEKKISWNTCKFVQVIYFIIIIIGLILFFFKFDINSGFGHGDHTVQSRVTLTHNMCLNFNCLFPLLFSAVKTFSTLLGAVWTDFFIIIFLM